MRLPHITIEYRDEEVAGVGKISPALVAGFGLHWAWVFSAMFSAGELFSFSMAGMASIMVVTSMASMALTLLCYSLFTSKVRCLFRTIADRRRVRFVAAAITSVGLLCVAVGAAFGNAPVCAAACVFGGVTTGVGSAALLMSYGVSFSVCDTAASAMQFALSCLVTSAAYALIMVANVNMHPLGVVLCALTPWAELFCLNVSSKQLVDRTEFASTTMPVHTGRFFARIMPSALAFGFLFGFLGMHAFHGVSELAVDASSFTWSVMAAGIITCVSVVTVMLTMRQRANYAFRALSPLIALVVVLVAHLLASGITTVVHCLFLVAYMLIEGCLWISYTDMSQKFRISPFHVYGAGRGMVAVGGVVATLLMLPASPWSASLMSADAILPVALVLLVFGSSTYPRDAEVVGVLRRGTCCPAFFDPFDPHNESFKTMEAARVEAADAGDDRADAASVSVLADGDEVCRQEAPTGADASSDSLGLADAVALPDDAEGCESRTAGVLTQQHVAAVQARACDDAEARSSCDHEEERVGRYKRRCLALADMCLLSRRETEVLFLLAKGYNTKMIQEQLFISAGTANTHMRHVYRKLDVHSQQDLIRMVDSMEVEDEDW
ncbi:LuxR C-terminal-related transcriptional regulator [uncultured Senegalimassilia sp.]|uniref:helix-turn-helix transcriptional regulator n=1 Tax=uncultured Senegalimassilia sp. TaxID=1714350 RepID=UPI0027DC0690|nr:LuxR C-terminal-related transcriptional regulator [uncultured Senegalimassilia sp.]